MSMLLVLVFVLSPTQTTRPVDLRNLPPDWPPLPDFKHTVDYVRWCEQQNSGGEADDASALWQDLRKDGEEHRRLWGSDGDGGVPGLFTGIELTPDRYAWDPTDHPNWENAYQNQRKSGLRDRIVAASRKRHLIHRGWLPQSRPAEDKGGTTADSSDYLVVNMLFPSMALQRHAAKVLLQNAWRAPAGKVDPLAMEEALKALICLAEQVESNRLNNIANLVALALKDLAYGSARRAIDEGVFDRQHIVRFEQWLAQNDGRRADQWSSGVAQAATLHDILQFAYLPENGLWLQPPQPNRRNVEKLAAMVKRWNESFVATAGLRTQTTVDLVEQIDRCAPETAVQQIVRYHLRCRAIREQMLPWQAELDCRLILRQLQEDADTHIIIRRFSLVFYDHSLKGACCEAHRRATRIILALHRIRAQTGQWPTSLRRIWPSLPQTILTDPFSGRPFIYRLEDGKPMLYSAGYNAKDDGGKHVPYSKQEDEKDGVSIAVEGDYVYWPVQNQK